MDVDTLIKEVCKRPPIWDKRKRDHSNKEIVNRCWRSIATTMKSDEVPLRKKWRYLRDNFAAVYSKRCGRKSGSADTWSSRAKWMYFDSLIFLKDVVTPRIESGSLNSVSRPRSPPTESKTDRVETDITIESNDEDCDDPDDEVEGLEFSVETIACPSDLEDQQENQTLDQLSFSRAPKRKTEEPTYKEPILNFKEKKAQFLLDQSDRQAEEEKDADLHFLKSLLPHVRMIPQKQKLRFQAQVQTVVQDFAYPQPAVVQVDGQPSEPSASSPATRTLNFESL